MKLNVANENGRNYARKKNKTQKRINSRFCVGETCRMNFHDNHARWYHKI